MRKLLLFAFLFLVLVAAVVGGVVGRFLSPHMHGKELWLAWKAERISLGDRFEWHQLVPPEIPDAENFARAPLIAAAFVDKDHIDPRFKALELPKVEADWGGWKEGRKLDLEAFGKAFGTRDLALALAPCESALAELKQASLRPRSRIPVDYAAHETPALLGFRSATRMLCLRALSQLEQGANEAALEDILTCLRMADHLKAEPSLLACLLRQAMLSNILQVVWEGLEGQRWTVTQLEVLQSEFSRIDLLASARLAWEGERLLPVDSFTCAAEGLPQPRGLQDPKKPERPPRLGSLGRGWFYRNLLEIDRYYVGAFLEVIDPKAHRVYPERCIKPEEWLEQRRYRKDLLMALIAIPALGEQVVRQAHLQSYLDQTALVCALQRFKSVRGVYPSSLNQLTPEFLQDIPREVTTGEPLHYVSSGHDFRLHSVGWNLKDDGGALARKSDEGKRVLDPSQGDWPWPSRLP